MKNQLAEKIFFNGEDITDWDITKRALAGISFAFQQPVRFKGIGVKDLLSLAAGEKLSTSGACTYLSEVGLCAADYVNREGRIHDNPRPIGCKAIHSPPGDALHKLLV